MQDLIHRKEPNRPHISSDTIDFKERETKSTRSANTLWRNLRQLPLYLLPRVPPEHRSVVPSGPPCSTSAPFENCFLITTHRGRKRFFENRQSFSIIACWRVSCGQFEAPRRYFTPGKPHNLRPETPHTVLSGEESAVSGSRAHLNAVESRPRQRSPSPKNESCH